MPLTFASNKSACLLCVQYFWASFDLLGIIGSPYTNIFTKQKPKINIFTSHSKKADGKNETDAESFTENDIVFQKHI